MKNSLKKLFRVFKLQIGNKQIGCLLDVDNTQVYEVNLPLKPNTNYAEVCFMGDTHIGNEFFSESHLKKYLRLVKDNPHIRVVGLGDYLEACEFANWLNNEKIRTKFQVQKFIELFKPIAKQIIAMVYGNHDERLQKGMKDAIDLLDYLRLKMGNPNIIIGKPQSGLLLIFHVGKQTYSVYVLHSSTGAIVHPDTQLRRTSLNYLVSLIVHGHVHRLLWKNRTYFTVGKFKGKWKRVIVRQYQLLSGCFLRYPAYAENKSYPVTDIGAPIIRFYADSQRIEYVEPLTDSSFSKYFKKHKRG